jgi:uncharacterized protein YgiM (DUF1202 family)
MRKVIFLSLIALSANLYATTIDRRVELLENAVVKLIDENIKLKNAVEINKVNILALHSKTDKKQPVQNTFYAEITSFCLNIRKEATLKSKIIGKLKKNDLVRIYEAKLNGDTIWYKINKGYISSKFTSLVYGKGINQNIIKYKKGEQK